MLRCIFGCIGGFSLMLNSLHAAADTNVTVKNVGGHVHIEVGGKPFTDFYYGPDAPKPYLHPLRSASGTIVTRGFPMENIPGESTTDQHHRGVWLGYRSVNGYDFWENEFSYHNKNAGKVVTRSVDRLISGRDHGSVHGVFAWLSPSGEAMLEEDRTMTFRGDNTLRMVDADITLKALVETTFGDSKDGAFSVRLAEPLIEKNGGLMVNSEGGRKMDQCWGKPASWVDYSGVALFEHPTSFRHPSRWHVRDYGLLAVNPFGSRAYDKTAPESKFFLPLGQSIHLKYRIVIHPPMDASQIATMYEQYAR